VLEHQGAWNAFDPTLNELSIPPLRRLEPSPFDIRIRWSVQFSNKGAEKFKLLFRA
jgi:hypothetical protein